MNRNDSHDSDGDSVGRGRPADDFWGDTPDWTDAPARPRRADRRSDATGAIRNLWSAALSRGSEPTREHGVVDATAARPDDGDAPTPPLGASGFDDLDDFGPVDSGPSPLDAGAPTESLPVIDVERDAADARFVAAATAADVVDEPRRVRAIDPLLARVGALAVVTTLIVPLAIGIASGDDTDDTLASSQVSASSLPADVAPTGDITAAASATTTAPSLDPATLPPAVPVADTAVDVDTVAPIASSEASTPATAPSSVPVTESSSDDADVQDDPGVQVEQATSRSDSSDEAPETIDSSASVDAAADRDRNCAIEYEVVAGDSWFRLADAAGVSLPELLEVNGATANTVIHPGLDICLPAGATTPAPPTTPPATQPTTTEPATTEPEAPTTTSTTVAPTTVAPTTTEAPTTTAPPTTIETNTDAGPDEVERIIRAVWPDELEEKALLIAFRESRYEPTAKNYCCYGLFQMYWDVHKSWLGDLGITSAEQLYDPETNARAAYGLYQRSGGWGPWSQTNY